MLSLGSHKPGAKEKDERPLVSDHLQALYSACACGMSPLPGKVLCFLQILTYCAGFRYPVKDVTVPQSPRNSLQQETDDTFSFSTQLPNRYLIISKLFNLWNMGFSLLWTGESDPHPADHAELLKGPKKMLDGKVLVN